MNGASAGARDNKKETDSMKGEVEETCMAVYAAGLDVKKKRSRGDMHGCACRLRLMCA